MEDREIRYLICIKKNMCTSTRVYSLYNLLTLNIFNIMHSFAFDKWNIYGTQYVYINFNICQIIIVHYAGTTHNSERNDISITF